MDSYLLYERLINLFFNQCINEKSIFNFEHITTYIESTYLLYDNTFTKDMYYQALTYIFNNLHILEDRKVKISLYKVSSIYSTGPVVSKLNTIITFVKKTGYFDDSTGLYSLTIYPDQYSPSSGNYSSTSLDIRIYDE